VVVSPSAVSSGGGATVTVTLAGRVPAGGASITLSSSNASAFNPASILIPVGQLVGTVAVTAGTVSSPATVTVTAAYNGSQASGTVTVTAQ